MSSVDTLRNELIRICRGNIKVKPSYVFNILNILMNHNIPETIQLILYITDQYNQTSIVWLARFHTSLFLKLIPYLNPKSLLLCSEKVPVVKIIGFQYIVKTLENDMYNMMCGHGILEYCKEMPTEKSAFYRRNKELMKEFLLYYGGKNAKDYRVVITSMRKYYTATKIVHDDLTTLSTKYKFVNDLFD